jgi:AraC-like DNA-binding protein
VIVVDRTLAQMIREHAPQPGAHPTELPGLTLVKMEAPLPRTPVVYGTSICVVAQGAKQAHLGDRTHVYDAGHYLICSLTLPIESEIPAASARRPFLGIVLDVDPALVGRLVIEMDEGSLPSSTPSPAVASSPVTPALSRVIHRMVAAAADPTDRRVLGPSLMREAIYEVLRGPHGRVLRDCAARDGAHAKVPRVIRFLEQNFARTLDVDEIARFAAMSPSALHKHFKEATTMSPMQYVKKLRLHHARTLLLSGRGAGEAGFEVGYASASQFSREFKRMFGQSPQGVRATVSA